MLEIADCVVSTSVFVELFHNGRILKAISIGKYDHMNSLTFTSVCDIQRSTDTRTLSDLLDAFKANQSLKVLTLSVHPRSADVVEALVSALQYNQSLEYFYLHGQNWKQFFDHFVDFETIDSRVVFREQV